MLVAVLRRKGKIEAGAAAVNLSIPGVSAVQDGKFADDCEPESCASGPVGMPVMEADERQEGPCGGVWRQSRSTVAHFDF